MSSCRSVLKRLNCCGMKKNNKEDEEDKEKDANASTTTTGEESFPGVDANTATRIPSDQTEFVKMDTPRKCSYSSETDINGEITTIFKSCDADQSGELNFFETQYGLQGLGLYPNDDEIEQTQEDLHLKFPLDVSSFKELIEALMNRGCQRGLHTVPYARRGLTLKQIKAIRSGLLETGWLQLSCDKFNADYLEEIQDDKKLIMMPNLYAMNEFFVMETTRADPNTRNGIPQEVLEAAGVPEAPETNCSFAQLLNPEGVEVDYFVSHYWGHPLTQTVQSLSNFAESVYKSIGKSSPDEVVFWICLFALNQHQAAEEVGSTPEQGPFNAALANAKHGAVMVLDAHAEPMQRIWCLYEVSRAKKFNKELRLIVDEGGLEKATIETLEDISASLRKVRAFNANSSSQSDKDKILYRILNPSVTGVLYNFKAFMAYTKLNTDHFSEFDAYVCSLIGTPLLAAGLIAKSKTVCLSAIGMEAMVTVKDLHELMQNLHVDVNTKVETRFGPRSLLHVYAKMGQVGNLTYVLEHGADIENKDNSGYTALILAAQYGHEEIITLLLDRSANIEEKTNSEYTALHEAADNGHTDIVTLLLDRGAKIDIEDDGGYTALYWASYNNNPEIVTILLDRGANIDHQDNQGCTVLHWAAQSNRTEIVRLLLDRGINIDAENKRNKTALEFAKLFKCEGPTLLLSPVP